MLDKLLFLFAAAGAVASLRPNILNGTPSDDGQDSVVMLFRLNDEKTSGNVCTAALIAPRLLLTARHCVAETDDSLVACQPDGTPIAGSGGAVRRNFDPASIYVFTGKERAAFTRLGPPTNEVDSTKWQPAARGSQIFDDFSATLCNHDIALVLTDTPITNVPIAKLRLNGEPKEGEAIVNVGYGITDKEFEPPVRQQRRDVTVKKVGPFDSFPILARNEFSFSESICEGDSGGPILAGSTGAVIGVVSRGTNGEDPVSPGATCPLADNIGTKLAPFREMLDQGFAAAGAQPQLEPEEDDGCSVSAAGRGSDGGAALLGLAAALVVRRKRKTVVS
ncbi:MAG: trypsin-like serine protease [Labilithrix sp.]|nr:trypsin-like serine protease [Labilithrix sp.]MCW5816144.1 trypsin-like serine protease [Labilithrix sp.]